MTENFDDRPMAGSVAQPPVESHYGSSQLLGQSYVQGVIGRQVMTEGPNPGQ